MAKEKKHKELTDLLHKFGAEYFGKPGYLEGVKKPVDLYGGMVDNGELLVQYDFWNRKWGAVDKTLIFPKEYGNVKVKYEKGSRFVLYDEVETCDNGKCRDG